MNVRRVVRSSLWDREWPSQPRPLRVAVLAGGTVLFVCLFLWLATGTVAGVAPDGQYDHGDESDNRNPVLTNGTKINDTAVSVTVADNHDVDESTIFASSFLLSHGSIERISVTEDGSDARVTIVLTDPVNVDEVTVALRDDTGVADTSGNTVASPDAVTVVSGMDGVAPAVREFDVTNATGGPATISLEATEDLKDFNVSVLGPPDDSFDRSTFTALDGTGEYERTYRPEDDGRITVWLTDLTDEAGNTRQSGFKEQILVDLTPPNAEAALDLANSGNLSITFDGSQSTDANGVAEYHWAFGDNKSARGPRVSHQYRPGNYTVTLNVSDPYGNTATDTLALNLSTGSGNVTDITESELRERVGNGLDVTVQRPGGDVGPEAIVGVTNARANETVPIGRANGSGRPLARAGGTSLSGMSLTLGVDRSFDLGLSMAGAGSVSDAAAATGTRPVAGFTVVNSLSETDVRNATIRFGVDRDVLAGLDATAEEVSLYRGSGGQWERVETTHLGRANGTERFLAEPPGFSRFAVVVETSPSFSVTDASLDADRVEPDEPFSATATVRNSGDGDGQFTAGLTVDGEVVTTATQSVAAGSSETLSMTWGISEPGTYRLTVNGTAAGELTVEEESAETAEETDAGANESGQLAVTNASLSAERVPVDEPFTVNLTVENTGDERAQFTAGLAVDGETVYVTPAGEPIPPGESRQFQVQYFFEESGEYRVSVNGTDAGTLQVGDDDEGDAGGGGIVGTLAGIVPLGLLRPVVLFVVAPVVAILGVLKGLAYYLGY